MNGETLTVLAYAAIWVILTVFLVLLARRQMRLEAEIRALRKSLPASPPSPPSSPLAPAARP